MIARDNGCVLRFYPEAGDCGGYTKAGDLILQAEHLVTRANSASFAELDNVVCLCQRHHGYFKPQHSLLYWSLIERHIGPERWRKVQAWLHDARPHRMTERDWVMASLVLRQELER